jgi:hypothetical protein
MSKSTLLEHLAPTTQRWVEYVQANWDLDEHHKRLLQLAAEAWDRAQQSRRALDVHGLTYVDRFGRLAPGRRARSSGTVAWLSRGC